MFLIVLYIFIKYFKKSFKKYGRAALGISGAITAFAFPMWSVATAIAFASAVHVFTGFSLTLSVAFTAFLLYLYLQAGGMFSIALTQTIKDRKSTRLNSSHVASSYAVSCLK